MASATAVNAVERILDDLTGRRGLRQEWDAIDEDTQIEIREVWRDIIDREIAEQRSLQP